MDDIIIRRMTIEDCEAVADVLISSWREDYRGIVSDRCLDDLDRAGLTERRKTQYKDYIVAVSDLKSQGRKKMVIWCLKDNHPARRFYEKMGGTVIGEHKTHIGDQDYDEVGFFYSI